MRSPSCTSPRHACSWLLQVFYGMDYLSPERSQRLDQLRSELLSHLKLVPDALLVIEEYDKLDCEARAMWRQLLQHPERANVSWTRAIVMMESNLGMSELEQMLTAVGNRSQASSATKHIGHVLFVYHTALPTCPLLHRASNCRSCTTAPGWP